MKNIITGIHLFVIKLLTVSVKDISGNGCGGCDLLDFPCAFVDIGCPIENVRKFRWRKKGN